MCDDEAIWSYYRKWGIVLVKTNGDERYKVPVPATYVIDSNGIIRAAHVDKDYTRRMEPAVIVEAVKAL